MLLEFFKVHYNFAALGVIFAMLSIYLYTRGNLRWSLIIAIFLGAYLYGIHSKTMENPQWVVQMEQSMTGWDFVGWIWGTGSTTQMRERSEDRMRGK